MCVKKHGTLSRYSRLLPEGKVKIILDATKSSGFFGFDITVIPLWQVPKRIKGMVPGIARSEGIYQPKYHDIIEK